MLPFFRRFCQATVWGCTGLHRKSCVCWQDASPWVHRGHWLSLLPTGGLCGRGSWLRSINNWKSPGWPKRINMFPIMPPEWWPVGACKNIWPWRKISVDSWVLLRTGLTGSKCQAGWSMSPEPLVRLSDGSCPAIITVPWSCQWPLLGQSPKSVIEPWNLLYALPQKFLVFSWSRLDTWLW